MSVNKVFHLSVSISLKIFVPASWSNQWHKTSAESNPKKADKPCDLNFTILILSQSTSIIKQINTGFWGFFVFCGFFFKHLGIDYSLFNQKFILVSFSCSLIFTLFEYFLKHVYVNSVYVILILNHQIYFKVIMLWELSLSFSFTK